MNPLYGGQMSKPYPQYQMPQSMNPMQRIGAIMQAMRNPPAFVRQAIPDLPAEIANDPNQILRYLQQTRGISDQQIQQIAGMIPRC